MIDTSDDRQRSFTVPELCELFNVHEDTVNRWGKQGLMGAFRTPSAEGQGHWRFLAHKVREQMRGDRAARHDQQDPPPAPVAPEAAAPARAPGPPGLPGREAGDDGDCPAWRDGECECAVSCIRRTGPYADSI